MRILWLSPWLRTLARVQIDALSGLGHECRLVTTDQHYEPVDRRPDERVLDARLKNPRALAPVLRTWREMRAWDPDVVVTEVMHDPRWLPMTRLAPLVHVVHDDRPHDLTERVPLRRQAVFDHLTRAADRVVAPSAYVAAALAEKAGRRVDVVPLTSDLPEAALPEVPVPVDERRDIVLPGRMSPYKNVPVVAEAWRRHTRSSAWRGDRLILLGDGQLGLGGDLPDHVEWRRGHFAYADVLPVLARAKGVVAHYRQATQSGVQVLAMQLGVTPVVSGSGGLAEFTYPEAPPLDMDDVDGLASTFAELADPSVAASRGAAARAHFLTRFSAEHAARAWESLILGLTRHAPA